MSGTSSCVCVHLSDAKLGRKGYCAKLAETGIKFGTNFMPGNSASFGAFLRNYANFEFLARSCSMSACAVVDNVRKRETRAPHCIVFSCSSASGISGA